MPNAFETTFQQRVIPAANRGFGVEVTLSRGVQTSEPFTARRNEKTHKSEGGKYGLDINVVMRDWILPVASVVVDGSQIEPRRLDVILEIATSERFEVLQPDENTPAVELMPGGYEWLVHTKKIEVGL
jgi:hypothetical protein